MMNPKAMEALKKARELFAEQKDDIPADAQAVEPIRRPQVHLIPTNAPKFDKETMKQEHKNMENGHSSPAPKQIDKYVEMSTRQATQVCLNKGIKKPADIAKETGKKVDQIYTAMWAIKKAKKAQRTKQKLTPKQEADVWNNIKQVSDDFDPRREPTAWEDAHMVVLKSRAEYEKEIEKLNQRITDLLIEKQEQSVIIKYFERKLHV